MAEEHLDEPSSTPLVIIAEALVVLLACGVTIGLASNFANSEIIFKTNTAESFRMWVDTFVSLPGDAVIAYPQNLSAYVLDLSESKVTVLRKGEQDSEKIIREFVLPPGFSAEGTMAEIEKVCLEKKALKITLRECRPDEKISPSGTGGI
jgi:hypothetical protein